MQAQLPAPHPLYRAALLCLIALFFCSSSYAQRPLGVTAGEMARLPEYCAQSQSFAVGGFAEGPLLSQKPWIALMGHGFWAIHHYCWALINANRAAAAGVAPSLREHLLTRALGDCNYVIQNTPQNFVLLPEIFLRMGEYYEQLDKPGDAIQHYDRSLQAKPDYWPAYLRISELQFKLGNRLAAEKALRNGLKAIPARPELQAALDRLVGKNLLPSAGRPASASSGIGQGAK